MLDAPTNVRFWGKTDVDQPLLTKSRFMSTGPSKHESRDRGCPLFRLRVVKRASDWTRRDLTAASVFVVFGELDFVEFLCLSQASRLKPGKGRKSARSGAPALASVALCLVHAHSCCKYLRPCRGALQQHVECSPHLSSPASLARQMHTDTFAVL
jgi:hypothetical protein